MSILISSHEKNGTSIPSVVRHVTLVSRLGAAPSLQRNICCFEGKKICIRGDTI